MGNNKDTRHHNN